MITKIAHTALLVRDYDEAIAFYRDILGFHVAEDTLQPTGKRWVRLATAATQGGCELLLARAADDKQRAAVGNQTGGRVLFFFHTDDFDTDYRRLCEHGVEFTEGPFIHPYGRVGVFKDLYGNRIDLIQPTF